MKLLDLNKILFIFVLGVLISMIFSLNFGNAQTNPPTLIENQVEDVNNSYISTPKIDVFIEGTSVNDNLKGGAGNDGISGENGDDKLLGNNGDDDINGGEGDDIIDGGPGKDRLRGGAGYDLFICDKDDQPIDFDSDDKKQGPCKTINKDNDNDDKKKKDNDNN